MRLPCGQSRCLFSIDCSEVEELGFLQEITNKIQEVITPNAIKMDKNLKKGKIYNLHDLGGEKCVIELP